MDTTRWITNTEERAMTEEQLHRFAEQNADDNDVEETVGDISFDEDDVEDDEEDEGLDDLIFDNDEDEDE